MRILLAGAMGALGASLDSVLVAAGQDVVGLSRTPGGRDRLRTIGAEPVISDVMNREALLRAVDGLGADAVIHQLTALKKLPVRHRHMAATDALREEGTANLLAAARAVGACWFVTQSIVFECGTERVQLT